MDHRLLSVRRPRAGRVEGAPPEAELAAEEQRAQARRQALDADELSAVAEREKVAARTGHERAQEVDPDVA